ncbi:MAG TPA: bifunctional DNA-binding transcriptional regulator/O6-methylguanine-DNA methyltransferase Ada [Fontimonas sp.]
MNEQHCWEALQARDESQDGRFWYGVLTTGIYCRPSCPSRLPLRRNVCFFASTADAESSGLRPCKRCRPDELAPDARAARMHALCRYIEAHADQSLTLEALGEQAHLSPFHLQRQFKAVIGVSPRQFVEACRLRALRGELKAGESVTQAIHEAGFGSGSRLYEKVSTRLGMTPGQYRARGAGTQISYASAACALGRVMMGATDRGLCFVQFADSDDALLSMLRAEYPAAQLAPMAEAMRPEFDRWMQALAAHLAGTPQVAGLPLDLRGTALQMKVWAYLQQIPSGELRSYSEVAAAIGEPRAVRAVASACGRNRVGVFVPCHRVIRGDGSMGGYKWGLARKRALIDAERGRGE